jgi:hypothetical protein
MALFVGLVEEWYGIRSTSIISDTFFFVQWHLQLPEKLGGDGIHDHKPLLVVNALEQVRRCHSLRGSNHQL